MGACMYVRVAVAARQRYPLGEAVSSTCLWMEECRPIPGVVCIEVVSQHNCIIRPQSW